MKDFLWSLEKIEKENQDTRIADKFITAISRKEKNSKVISRGMSLCSIIITAVHGNNWIACELNKP